MSEPFPDDQAVDYTAEILRPKEKIDFHKRGILFPTSIHVDPSEPPLPMPIPKVPTAEEIARRLQVQRWAAISVAIRSALGWGVVMLDDKFEVVGYEDNINPPPFGTTNVKKVVRSNHEMTFANSPKMFALGLPLEACGMVVCKGPKIARDVYGKDYFRDTVTFYGDDETSDVVRLLRPLSPLVGPRETTFKKWTISWDVEKLVVLDSVKVHVPQNQSTPFSQIPSFLMDQLTNA